MIKQLRLYIVGNTAAADEAVKACQVLIENPLLEGWDLRVIDVVEEPHLAEEDRIIAVPALIKKLPPPIRRFVGDLSEKQRILLGLDILPRDETG